MKKFNVLLGILALAAVMILAVSPVKAASPTVHVTGTFELVYTGFGVTNVLGAGGVFLGRDISEQIVYKGDIKGISTVMTTNLENASPYCHQMCPCIGCLLFNGQVLGRSGTFISRIECEGQDYEKASCQCMEVIVSGTGGLANLTGTLHLKIILAGGNLIGTYEGDVSITQ